ncbi:MAG: hypothetical protein SNF68_06010 [Rikenellaceae bacterium]
MESNQYFELVGGITRVVLRLASTPLPELGDEDSSGVDVNLNVGDASYVERQYLDAGQYRVIHTLSFQCEHADAPFSPEQIQRILTCGVVADVTLATGAVIRVGWSERFGVEYPLRLQSLEFSSGGSAVDYPLQSWVWSSTDRETLM